MSQNEKKMDERKRKIFCDDDKNVNEARSQAILMRYSHVCVW